MKVILDTNRPGQLFAAVGGRADVLVTGDKEMQNVGAIEGAKILSPRQFWEKLKEK